MVLNLYIQRIAARRPNVEVSICRRSAGLVIFRSYPCIIDLIRRRSSRVYTLYCTQPTCKHVHFASAREFYRRRSRWLGAADKFVNDQIVGYTASYLFIIRRRIHKYPYYTATIYHLGFINITVGQYSSLLIYLLICMNIMKFRKPKK